MLNLCRLLLLPALFGAVGCLNAAPEPVKEAESPLEMLDFVAKVEKASSPELKKIDTLRLTYRGEIPANKINFTSTNCFKRPDLMRMEIYIPGVMGSLELYDGQTGWKIAHGLGAKKVSGRELDFMKLQARLGNPTARLTEIFPTITLDKVPVTIDGTVCRRLLCDWPKEIKLAPIELFFDAKTHLLRRSVMAAPTGFGDVPVTTDYSDYKNYQGLFLPVKHKGRSLGMELEITLTRCEQNIDLPDSLFKPPFPEE